MNETETDHTATAGDAPEKISFSSDTAEAPDTAPLTDTADVAPPAGRAELVASATPDGTLTLTGTAIEGFVPRREADRLAEEAYIRGRNEAIEERWGELTAPPAGDTPPEPDSLADIFTFRQSVWK